MLIYCSVLSIQLEDEFDPINEFNTDLVLKKRITNIFEDFETCSVFFKFVKLLLFFYLFTVLDLIPCS
jgi:hypothetical protein